MDKLGRSYELTVQRIDGRDQVFTLPYSIEFAVDRNNFSSPNTASISIYNLSQDTRNQLRKDAIDTDVSRRVKLRVGYGDIKSTIFDGTLDHCWSARQGVHFITHLQCRDNGFVYDNIDVTINYAENQSKKSVVENIIQQLSASGISRGVIGDIAGTFPRRGSKQGNAMKLLREITGDNVFIDTGKIYCLNDGQEIIGPVTLIDSANGLIGTPIVENTFLNVEMLLEPRVLMCQKVKLITTTGSNAQDITYHYGINSFNGDYKITGISHRGIISETVAGSATTSLVLSGQRIEQTYRGLIL